MTEVILVSLMVINILTNVTSYLLNSRCTHIESPCLSCDRTVLEKEETA